MDMSFTETPQEVVTYTQKQTHYAKTNRFHYQLGDLEPFFNQNSYAAIERKLLFLWYHRKR